jgi:hypothetical protein
VADAYRFPVVKLTSTVRLCGNRWRPIGQTSKAAILAPDISRLPTRHESSEGSRPNARAAPLCGHSDQLAIVWRLIFIVLVSKQAYSNDSAANNVLAMHGTVIVTRSLVGLKSITKISAEPSSRNRTGGSMVHVNGACGYAFYLSRLWYSSAGELLVLLRPTSSVV